MGRVHYNCWIEDCSGGIICDSGRCRQEILMVVPNHSKLDKRDRFLSNEKSYAGNPKLDDQDKAYMKADKN